MAGTSFTGRTRRRRTARHVKVADVVARLLITFGGISTIAAVALVCVYLVTVVVPLFGGSSASAPDRAALPRPTAAASLPAEQAPPTPLYVALDEYQVLGWSWWADGTLTVFRAATGEVVARRRPFPAPPTAQSFAPREDRAAFAFVDGSVRLATLAITATHVAPAAAPERARALRRGEAIVDGEALFTASPIGELRRHELLFTVDEPIQVADAPIVALDVTGTSSGPVIAAVAEPASGGGELRLCAVHSRRNQLRRTTTIELKQGQMPLPDYQTVRRPSHVLLSGVGTAAYVAWPDGRLLHVDARHLQQLRVVETVDLVADPQHTLTSLAFLIGRTTLAAGDSSGTLRAWFPARRPNDGAHGGHGGDSGLGGDTGGGDTGDGDAGHPRLVIGHLLGQATAAVTALAPSQRTRLIVAGHADGSVRLYHVTSEKLLAAVQAVSPETEPGGEVGALTIAPKDDAILAATPAGLWRWHIDVGHPEVTLPALFTKVWYEGYPEPAHVWQSSSGTDEFEPKLGLWPLVFGTLKATLYSLLFGVPLALLAAIYTSEFLAPRARARVKPLIEMMASLPSVVLGFIAALIVAPFVEDVVPELLTAFLTLPLAFLLTAYLWQLLPKGFVMRWQGWRFLFAFPILLAGIAAAGVLGPLLEQWLFAGDLKHWLSSRVGSGLGGWFFLFLPLAALLVAFLSARCVTPRLRARNDSRAKLGLLDLLKFALLVVVATALALALAGSASLLDLDPRGTVVDTYVQRNALIVGFIMGFAVIPIIYTVSDDALSAVPEHLRAASLGAGATPWQTAVRIIVPTAMSGLFSAIMIGFGRAVGETMIVLMAAGNTPVLDWNIFNGFRTLSANIAVELPEAVQGSTHYRTLFFAALLLFAITFAVNTAAESVRLRFRKRAYQL